MVVPGLVLRDACSAAMSLRSCGDEELEDGDAARILSAVRAGAAWFETRGVAALLTMRVYVPHPELVDLILRSGVSRVSKDEAKNTAIHSA